MSARFSFRWKVFALALLVAAYAVNDSYAANIILRAFYPVPYGEYTNLTVRSRLTIGSQFPLSTGLPASTNVVSASTIYGNMTLNGSLTTTNALWTLNSNYGPYGEDSFHVSTGLQSGANKKVTIGANEGENRTDNANTEPRYRVGTARFKAHTVIAGQTLYALDYWNTAGPNSVTAAGESTPTAHHVFGMMRGFTDTSRTVTSEQKKAQFRSMYHQSSDTNVTNNNTVFAPLHIDGYYVRFGEKIADVDSALGYMNTVLIRCQKPWYKAAQSDPWQPQLFLQVGRPGQAAAVGNGDFQVFSSRMNKKDVMPLTPAEYGSALDRITHTPLFRYRMKDDPETNRLEFGLIAEETPREMLTPEGKGINLMSAYGEVMAALRSLQSKNQALKKRLEYLENLQKSSTTR